MVDARTFQALSDPTRLKILSLLGSGSMNVSSMVEKLDCTQPAVSRHLKVLKEAGLIVDARHGKWIEYSSNPSTVAEAAEYLKALYEARRGAAPDSRKAAGRPRESAGRPRGPAGRAHGPEKPRHVIEPEGDFIDDLML
jgi:ArsR family transcriptional regulator